MDKIDPMLTQQQVERTSAQLFGRLNRLEDKSAPPLLYCIGEQELLKSSARVSVVGTRHPSSAGIKRAERITKELVNHNVTVVSGLAEGIDTVAHTTALLYGGRTIAVLGTPLDNPYPKSNLNLFHEIASNHLAVSQFRSGTLTQPKNFPIRNRTMALISDATIIVEAGESSGTKHQGWEALRLGRLLYLMESVVNDPSLTWAKEMVQYGAQILTRDNLDVVLGNLPKNTIGLEDDFAF